MFLKNIIKIIKEYIEKQPELDERYHWGSNVIEPKITARY